MIDTAKDILTDDSSLLYGSKGRPVKLKRHIDGIGSRPRIMERIGIKYCEETRQGIVGSSKL